MPLYCLHNVADGTYLDQPSGRIADAEFRPLSPPELPQLWEQRHWAEKARETWLEAHPSVPSERVEVGEVHVVKRD